MPGAGIGGPLVGAGIAGPLIPPNYQFAYGVQTEDGYHGAANFGHNEQRNGYATTGQYHVELPGSSQSVSYTVGAPGGYGPGLVH